MKTSLALALSVLSAIVSTQAQYDYGGGSSNKGSSSSSAPVRDSDHVNIDVATDGQLTFSPSSVTAPVGKLVTFFFPPGSVHSVTQSTFAAPCTYLAAASGNPGGFDSGLQTAGMKYTINITSTDPIYFYCKSADHCSQGMVGVINSPRFDDFQAAAREAEVSQQPSGGPIAGGVSAIGMGDPSPASTTNNAEGLSSRFASGLPSISEVATGMLFLWLL
ncbi:hypothetical protein FA15DRAFT_293332 [Coprinopsis marcescibilis]|uniref:Blue (type 1) copper domain-containing protein n=1 Tax=Coprinopsis marcescibilis TaxID=230819 RepID=A0A5C3L2I7_COPMA|nr:hypothetical protein FA15DRAFT_293332 [Coprinopsis marcescibilis]